MEIKNLSTSEPVPKIYVVVAGCRWFNNVEFIFAHLDHYLRNRCKDNCVIVSGLATGPDSIAIDWAKSRGFDWLEFPADWAAAPRAAGMIRNGEMAKIGTHLIAFWDFKSRGTEDMIKRAVKKDMRVEIVKIGVELCLGKKLQSLSWRKWKNSSQEVQTRH